MPSANYCLAMHLVKTQKEAGITNVVTPFGRVVFLEDKFFREALTQWIAHLYLCNKEDGGEIWHQIFWQSSQPLGMDFP